MFTPERTHAIDVHGTGFARRSLKQGSATTQGSVTAANRTSTMPPYPLTERICVGASHSVAVDRDLSLAPLPSRQCRGAEFRCDRTVRRMLDSFDMGGQECLRRACVVAGRMHIRLVQSEHLLLALLEDPAAVDVLLHMAIAPTDLRAELEQCMGGESVFLDDALLLAADTREVVRATLEELDGLGHAQAGAAHLLLGILSAGIGLGAEVLEWHGATVDALRQEVLEVLASEDAGAA